MRFLGLPPEDYRIAAAVLRRAVEMRDERERALADYVAANTAGLTARAITRWFGRQFKAMFSK